jgi:hypothetical protein
MLVIPPLTATFVADGGASGAIQVASAEAFFPGAQGYISADGLVGVKIIVSAIIDDTHILVQKHPDEGVISPTMCVPVSGRPNLSAYTVLLNAKITIPSQTLFTTCDGYLIPQQGVIPKMPKNWNP